MIQTNDFSMATLKTSFVIQANDFSMVWFVHLSIPVICNTVYGCSFKKKILVCLFVCLSIPVICNTVIGVL